MSDELLIPVRILRSGTAPDQRRAATHYNAGEVAGFPASQADRIVRRGDAEYYDFQDESGVGGAPTVDSPSLPAAPASATSTLSRE